MALRRGDGRGENRYHDIYIMEKIKRIKMSLKKIFTFIAFVSLFSAVLMGQTVRLSRTTTPMATLDSIYDDLGIVLTDFSAWKSITYDSNKGDIKQYRNLYETDSSKIVITVTEEGDDSTYIIQYLELGN